MDDGYLQNMISSVPSRIIILIEDIDCAFSSGTNVSDIYAQNSSLWGSTASRIFHESKFRVTLSGLLNVIDGIGRDDGRPFFAATHYLDRLDPALLRPGRIDVKIEYTRANRDQASALFQRFFLKFRFEGTFAV